MPRFDDTLLEAFMDGFFGYGNLDAPYWFIGMEEGGGDKVDEIEKRLAVWRERGEKLTEDLVDYHNALGITRHIGSEAKFQSTWAKLVRVLHILEDKPVDNDALRQTQGKYFGRSSGSSCLLELLPLPSPSSNRWLYGDHSGLPYLKDRKTYQETVRPQRIIRLKALIRQYRPRSVLFYGLGYREHWHDISGQEQDFESQQIGKFQMLSGHSEHSLFVVVPHPTSTGITKDYFNRVGELMRARLG